MNRALSGAKGLGSVYENLDTDTDQLEKPDYVAPERSHSVEQIGGKILYDIRDDQDVWLVSAAEQELMTFATFWRAQEWRRTTAVYVHYERATGCRFYVKKDQAWHVRGPETDTWQQADNQPWVESQVSAKQATYQQPLQPLEAV